jgi:hypothetical protein
VGERESKRARERMRGGGGEANAKLWDQLVSARVWVCGGAECPVRSALCGGVRSGEEHFGVGRDERGMGEGGGMGERQGMGGRETDARAGTSTLTSLAPACMRTGVEGPYIGFKFIGSNFQSAR